MYTYKAEILDWIDGDTAKIKIDLGFNLFSVQSLRVYGINAPEMNSKDAHEREHAKIAKTAAGVLAPAGRTVLVKSHKDKDKYGRFLAQMFLDDGREVGAEMVKAGHAKAWDGTGEKP